MIAHSALGRFAAGTFAATLAFAVVTFSHIASHAGSMQAIAAIAR